LSLVEQSLIKGRNFSRFISYRTGDYKLHYYETPTSMKFVMLTDTKTSSLRVVLHQIWVNLYVEYVVRNPLSPVEHPGGLGVNNELFEMGLDRFIVWLPYLAIRESFRLTFSRPKSSTHHYRFIINGSIAITVSQHI